MVDSTGIPGQGPTSNPASLFGNHQQIYININNTYYDPSYGLTFSSATEIDNNAIDGYFIIVEGPANEPVFNTDLNKDGDIVDLNVQITAFLFQENPPGTDLGVTRIDR